jgi:membrane protein implicated in regulation of membrane protease activity
MFTVYLGFLSFGVLLALGSLVLGQLGGGDGHDAGVDAGVDAGTDAGAHGAVADSHAGAGGHVSFPFFSPGVLGSFAAAFGAGGIIALESGATSLAINLPVALGSGVGLAYAAGWMMMKFLKYGESSTAVRTGELIGAECEVITEIPAGSVGEVLVSAGGSRSNFPARSEDGGTIPRGAIGTVSQMVGATLYINVARTLLEASDAPREKLELPVTEKEKVNEHR